MATNTVTTEQVREAIEQLAAMVAAGSISPQTVANILEMLRNLNDQERLKVIAAGEAYIQEILNTGITADHVTLDSGATVEDVISFVLNKISNDVASIIPSANGGDFDLADDNFNSILRLENGHIKTKKFDSENIKIDQNVDAFVDDSTADLNIGDSQGKVLSQFKGGHIKTKNFDSSGGYQGKRCCILGDSISTYGVPSSTNVTGTYTYPGNICRYSEDGNDSIQFDVNDTWWMRVIHQLGMTLGINDSWRGTTITSARGANICFCNQTRINHLGENGTPDLILVYGGTNDAGVGVTLGTFNTENPRNYTAEQIAALPIDTFANAYRTMLIRLLKTYPTAEIVAVLPNFCTSYYTITNLDDYVEIAREACDFFGVVWIDIRTAGINIYNLSSYLVDGIHPNAKGMKALADKIVKQLVNS